MRVPLSWLREFVDVELEPDRLAERLTLLGMEVKTVERWGADWQDVVVGELLSVEPHPRADRLSLTRVTVGDGQALDIVCGATNIAAGQRVPVALPGAVLPGGRRIERAEKMGVVSNGMLCSGDELRLTADADGILILPAETPVGESLVDLYGDWVLDVDVKPNRGDALSILGLAREVAAATGAEVRWDPEAVEPVEAAGPSTAERVTVDVRDPDLCSRFVGRWVGDVSVGPSPNSVQMRLRAAGLRPVSNVVDASNYVMWELGKPVHTFDAACIARSDERHAIVVRRATPGERLETLDHVARDLTTEDLVIADNRGPLAIAGVMGGADSEVSVSTRDVVIESAIFDPVAVRRTAQRHGLRSEASSRFEKGQDVPMARIGADRTAALIREWAGGEVAAGRVDTNPDEPTRLRVPFRPARVNRLVGVDLSADEQRDVLSRIGIDTETAAPAEPVVVALAPELLVVDAAAGEAVTALVPSWRRDLVVEADIAEEVARVSGYETTPSVTPDTPMPDWRPSPLEVRDLVRETLAGAGLSEVVTPALVSPGHLDLLRLRRDVPSVGTEPQPGGTPIVVTNPLSRDHSILRQSLLPSLVDVVATNLRHGADDVAVFEIGKGYAKDGSTPREWWRLGIALTGSAEPAHWSTTPRAYDLDDAKGLLELVLRRLGGPEPTYVPEREEPAFHPGRTARVDGGDVLHGIVGELHPGAIEWWDMRAAGRVVAAEIALAGLAAGTMVPERAPVVGRFPAVERDVAVVVPDETAAGDVLGLVRSAAGPLLRRVRLFDVYRGSPLAETEKSLAWRLTFEAPDRTLTEDEVDAAVEAVVSAIAGIGGRVRS